MTLRKISKKKAAKGLRYSLKRSAIKRKRRKKSETLRIYGPKARRAFVYGLPCAACGFVGYSQNAHVAGESGVGYKADARFIAPLCGFHVQTYFGTWPTNNYGCHTMFDEYPEEFAYKFPDFDPEKAAQACESAWQEFVALGSSK